MNASIDSKQGATHFFSTCTIAYTWALFIVSKSISSSKTTLIHIPRKSWASSYTRNKVEEHDSLERQLMRPKSTRHIWRPTWMDDFVTIITTKNALKGDFLLFVTKEPQSFDETTKHLGWIQGMKLEFDSIQRNKTWKLIDLPKGKKPISAKWVFKVKPNLD